jgi:hypothetical protein
MVRKELSNIEQRQRRAAVKQKQAMMRPAVEKLAQSTMKRGRRCHCRGILCFLPFLKEDLLSKSHSLVLLKEL